MNNDIPLRIDPVLFAKQERQFSGELVVADLPRIVEITPNPATQIVVTMSFSKSSLHYPLVKGTIDGEVVQICQRCLRHTNVAINSQFELLLVSGAAVESASQEGHEVFEYNEQHIDTVDFLEQEIILALPIVPKHSLLDECSASARKWIKNKEHVPADQPKENPFAKLKDLKI